MSSLQDLRYRTIPSQLMHQSSLQMMHQTRRRRNHLLKTTLRLHLQWLLLPKDHRQKSHLLRHPILPLHLRLL